MAVTLNASTSTGLVQSADTSGVIELQSNGTTALTVNTNEGIQILNCIGVGGATPSTSGAGITFPATQSASSDANTLDDYEEGTWTPVDGSGAGLTFTSASGTYIKIGKIVFINMFVEFPSTANGAAAFIAGIPFAPNNANTNYVGCVGLNDTAKANFYPFVAKDGSGIFIRNENNTNFYNTNMSQKTFVFTAQYLVA